MHKFAVKASRAALAAARQGKYNEISKVFLKNHKKLNPETIIVSCGRKRFENAKKCLLEFTGEKFYTAENGAVILRFPQK